MSENNTVTLTFAEMLVAGNGGVLRHVNAVKRRVQDPDAHHRDPLEAQVSGAIAEWAVAKWLGVLWDPSVGLTWEEVAQVPGDVGKIEVRSTPYPSGCLPLHDYSFDDRAYVLVLSHRAPEYTLAGWLWGREGKDRRFWRADLPRPCFLAPQGELRSMDVIYERSRRANHR